MSEAKREIMRWISYYERQKKDAEKELEHLKKALKEIEELLKK